MSKLSIAVVSGGLDSVTMAYYLASKGYKLNLVAFDYGQRHKKEIEFSKLAAQRLGASYDEIDITDVGRHLGGSSLTDTTIDVPDGHYAESTMKATVVPNRNAIFLTIAYGLAVARGANCVATAVHGGDHFIYPDCRAEFTNVFDLMQRHAVAGFGKKDLHLYTPFIAKTKRDIVTIGKEVGVPFNDTWSCYKGLDEHCGTCGTCVERKEAFMLAGVFDPTEYTSDRLPHQ